MGALTQLYAGTMPQAAEFGGKVGRRCALASLSLAHTVMQYMIPWARVGEARKETNDPKVGAELWAWLESQVKGV